MHLGTIRTIWRYPVSSLTGETLEEAVLDAEGVDGDRRWGLFDAKTGGVAGPESEKRWRPVPGLRSRLRQGEVEVSGDAVTWRPLPSLEADTAASQHLGFPVRFAPFLSGSPSGEASAPRYQRGHLHILTTASLARLQEILPNAVLDPRRFRPNLMVETEETGFAEKQWIGKVLACGAALIEISEPCVRCAFTALAQPGLPFDKDVLHAIARHGEGGFGVLAKVVAPATIRLGDRLSLA